MTPISKAEHERLTILIEECAEVIQAATKIQRHGWESYDPTKIASPSNRDHFATEIGQLICMIDQQSNDLPMEIVEEAALKKVEQLKKYTHFKEYSIDRKE